MREAFKRPVRKASPGWSPHDTNVRTKVCHRASAYPSRATQSIGASPATWPGGIAARLIWRPDARSVNRSGAWFAIFCNLFAPPAPHAPSDVRSVRRKPTPGQIVLGRGVNRVRARSCEPDQGTRWSSGVVCPIRRPGLVLRERRDGARYRTVARQTRAIEARRVGEPPA